MLARVLAPGTGLAALVLLFAPAGVLAQEPIDQPPNFADVRASFENMKQSDWEAAGYQVIPPGDCIASPAGGMGIHAINPQLHQAQFESGQVDADNPPLLLLDASARRVIGLEWEAAESVAEPPTLFGETFPLLPGHPGIEQPHYMLHAYFRPNGQVLFAEFDPQVSCELPPTSTARPVVRNDDGSARWLTLLAVFAGALVFSLRLLGRMETRVSRAPRT